jgi:hypothetical protein
VVPQSVELQVRNARVTDVDGITALLPVTRPGRSPADAESDADLLRPLVYLPNATVVVALAGRRVVGAAMLALRPSVEHGGLVGTIDLLASDPELDEATIAGSLIPEILRSARNKGCVRVEVDEGLGRVSGWSQWGFHGDTPRLSAEIVTTALPR